MSRNPSPLASYQRVDTLAWSSAEEQTGKLVHLRDFPKGPRVHLFRLLRSPPRSEPDLDFIVTNDRTPLTTQVVHEVIDLRRKVGECHRDTKQLTGIEACQCRRARIQRNHIGCAILVWNRLKQLAVQANTTSYQLKYGVLDTSLIQELRNPTLKMVLA